MTAPDAPESTRSAAEDTSVEPLLSSLSERGVRLWAEGGQLRFLAPKGGIRAEELDRLRASKLAIVELLERAQSSGELPLLARQPGSRIPLTAVQSQIWKYLNKDGQLSWRMCVTSARIRGCLNTAVLRRSVEALVRRHESLRTRFVSANGTLSQMVDDDCGGRFEVIDVSDLAANVVEERTRCLANEFVEEKVHLSVGPLFAARLFKLSDREHVLVLAADHIISDGESLVVLSRELWAAYSRAVQGKTWGLPRLPLQLADYAVWQEATHISWRSCHEPYWRQRLTGAPRLRLPTTGGADDVKSPVGCRLQVPFGEVLSAQIENTARRERTFPAIVVLTAYVAALSRWCNQRDFLLNFSSSGRSRPELQSMIGFLATPLPLRIEIAEDDCLSDLVRKLHLEFCAAHSHQDYSRLPDIMPECMPDVGFVWTSPAAWVVAMDLAECNIAIEPFDIVRKALPFRLESFFYPGPAGITWSVEYRPDVFGAGTIQRLGRNARQVAEKLDRQPHARIASIALED